MTSESLRELVLMLATVTTGLIAGLYYAYACSVMLGLRKVGDRVFIDVMQRINVAIQNGVFLIAFLGAALFAIAVIVLDLAAGRGLSVPVVAGCVLYVLSLVITFGINIPLNNRLDAAGEPSGIADPAAVRASFEATWNRWNVMRALVSLAGFVCLCWALLVS
ncbi:membrane protein [Microtetraspora sp. NBRC 13810]|uniref:anthrone oxygenase family protein n=1 Tax=Microtetraspora sp. NBRC 13810 TaxID=3030990 RepID=UPI0024A54192|nr:anthrone oxygenase family protein [Microtetraspora sp. NBRC 13810]GLW09195.1 membrane protein [Microtetraspora sp. NBRC 13810]